MTTMTKIFPDSNSQVNRRVTWDSVMLEPEDVQSSVRWRVSSYANISEPTETHPDTVKTVAPQLSASVSINDCRNVMTLEFGGYNSIVKLETMIKTLGDARNAILDHSLYCMEHAEAMEKEGYKVDREGYDGNERWYI